MQSLIQISDFHDANLAVLLARIDRADCGGKIKVRHPIKRKTTLGDVLLVLLRIVDDCHDE
jgi:hypothetical protein